MDILTFENALKEIYLPAWSNQLSVEPSALLSKVKKKTLVGTTITAAAPVGLNGGFGFGLEGTATPTDGNQAYNRFTTSAKDMFVTMSISDKALKLATTKGAMADALDTEIKSSYETAKWNVGRALFGNGTGILANVDALAVAGNTCKVNSIKNIREGLIVDFYATGAAVGSTPAVSKRRISSINRTASSGKYDVTFDGAATTLDAGFITCQNSYGREITGLNSIFDDSITSIYGVTKSSNQIIKPVTVDAGATIDDTVITKAMRESKNIKSGNVDMIFAGDTAFDAYMEYLRATNQRNEKGDLKLEGGFTAVSFAFGNRTVAIVNESFVPDAEMWGVDTSSLELHQTDWDFVKKDGGIFSRIPATSKFEALLANYGDLVCTNPGACIRIHNIA